MIRQAAQSRDEAFERASEARAAADALRASIEPKLIEIQDHADTLASAMRDRFRRSQEAYQAGDGELAASLSAEGKAFRRDCETLNESAQTYRDRRKAASQEIRKLDSEVRHYKDLVSTYRSELESLEGAGDIAYAEVAPGWISSPSDSEVLSAAWADSYWNDWPAARLFTIELESGSYLFDDPTAEGSSSSIQGLRDGRVVAAWGWSKAQSEVEARDRNRMRGHPRPSREEE